MKKENHPIENDARPLPGKIHEIVEQTFSRYSLPTSTRAGLLRAYDAIASIFQQNGILFLCGNGGSFADAMHIKGELAKRFEAPRPIRDPELIARLNQSEIGKQLIANLESGFPVVVLGESHSLRSAYENDRDPTLAYAQELYSLTPLLLPGVLLGISTSGTAANVVAAMTLAKAGQFTTISFTGPDGGALAKIADIDWRVPGGSIADIQENQVPLYHALCRMIEIRFFGQNRKRPRRHIY